jgi:endonuclease/exonuclease/phosphatase family metal-dependent hydrolase
MAWPGGDDGKLVDVVSVHLDFSRDSVRQAQVRLFNNEMGFLFTDPQLRQDLIDATVEIKRQAQRWGSSEWLQLRRNVAEAGGIKGYTTRHQRFIYKVLTGLGLVWQF